MNLSAFLHPKSVAVVGASATPHKLGHIILANVMAHDYAGAVVAVNPKLAGQTLLGAPCVGSLSDIEKPVDMAIIAVPPRFVLGVARDAAHNKTKSLVVITAGFGEVSNHADEEALKALCKEHNMRLLGPNCLGAIFPHMGLNASFAASMPEPGGIAFLSQSGAFCTAALDYAHGRPLGFSHFLSFGNKADINELDLITALAKDENVTCVALYLESIANGPAWMEAIRACHKPVVVLQPGESQAAQAASRSHTGSLAPSSTIARAAYAQAGAVQVRSMREMFTVLELITASTNKRRGPNVAVLTNAGGVGVLTADLLEREGLHLPHPTTETKTYLEAHLPAEAGLGNPYDLIGDATADRYATGIDALVCDPQIDTIFALLTPQKTTQAQETAALLVAAQANTDKLIVASFIGGPAVATARQTLQLGGVVVSAFPESIARGLGLLQHVHAGAAPAGALRPPKPEITALIATEKDQTSLSAQATERIAQWANLPIPQSQAFTDTTAAQAFWSTIQKPTVLKLLAPDALHKTELKGVHLHITRQEDFDTAWSALQKTIAAHQIKQAQIQVQEQVPQGLELIIGLKRDPTFGPVLVFGAGGIWSEIWHDTSTTVLPVRDWEQAIAQTRVGQILTGARGRTGVNMPQLVHVLDQLQWLFVQHPQLAAIDINPCVMTPDGQLHLIDIKLILHDA